MKDGQGRLAPATRYRIEVWGRFEVDRLCAFTCGSDVTIDGVIQLQQTAVLYVHTRPSHLGGLVRRLRGLGMAVLEIEAA